MLVSFDASSAILEPPHEYKPPGQVPLFISPAVNPYGVIYCNFSCLAIYTPSGIGPLDFRF